MIPLSTKPVRFTPDFPWHVEAGEGAPVYLIRPGTVYERDELESELVARRAGRVFDVLLYEAAREGVRAWMDGDELAQILDLIDQHQAGQLTRPADQAAWAQVEAALAEHWPAYVELCRQRARRNQMAPTLAAAMFLVGWENLDAEFKRGVDGRPTKETLMAVPALDLKAIGAHAYGLLYGESDSPLSARPSKSEADPKPSATGESRRSEPRGGRSTARSTRKTRTS